ncbi:hypothetical protein CBL_07928 [Carabus blaptoides fortunei]
MCNARHSLLQLHACAIFAWMLTLRQQRCARECIIEVCQPPLRRCEFILIRFESGSSSSVPRTPMVQCNELYRIFTAQDRTRKCHTRTKSGSNIRKYLQTIHTAQSQHS